ncbi:DUF7448 domain-containing protein [Antribacter gilvus]|uniref:DUF7448 domain-containing protein n=1 Tax=Antribacter gilvus TaxID=2304675 RepID=UPI000F7AB94A|nr:hypothetical protein [Antribacter gilvus]
MTEHTDPRTPTAYSIIPPEVARGSEEAHRAWRASRGETVDAEPERITVSAPYEPETLPEDSDDGTMPENVATLAEAVVGHRIVSVVTERVPTQWGGTEEATVITLDSGRRVHLADTDDCCAHTELKASSPTRPLAWSPSACGSCSPR